MKLLYVINHIDWFWSHRLKLAQGAQGKGWDVHVAVPHPDRKLSEQNFHGHDLGVGGIFKTILNLRQIVQQEKPDLIHAITLKYAFITGLAVLFQNVKVVYTIAGLGYLFSGEGLKPKILRLILSPLFKIIFSNQRTVLIFQNADDQALFIKRGFARAEQCHLIRGSGVDVQQFLRSDEPDHKIPQVVMATRLVHDKGVAVFVEAARLLKKRGVNARFQIAGGLTHDNPLAITQKQMDDMVADGAVEWLGKVSDMPALFTASNLIVYPSYYGEGVPKVLLEAAASGRAIITTNHPGCREVVHHGMNGLLVPIKDAEAAADAIEELLQDAPRRKLMGLKGRARAENEFDVRKIVAETLKVYETI